MSLSPSSGRFRQMAAAREGLPVGRPMAVARSRAGIPAATASKAGREPAEERAAYKAPETFRSTRAVDAPAENPSGGAVRAERACGGRSM